MRLRRGVNMKEYLIAMIGVCAVCFVVRELQIFGDNRYVSFVCGLCVVAVSVSPLLELSGWLRSLDIDSAFDNVVEQEEYSSYFDSYITESYIAEVEAEIKSYILEKYNLKEDNVRVNIYVGENRRLIYISLTGKGIFANTNKMKEELLERYSSEVEIVIGE